MGKARYRIALCAARLSIPVLRLTGHKATDFPGRVALKICPDFLKYIDRPRLVLGVTGTNGKTTISNLLTDLLREFGTETLNNASGSNTITGLVTSIVRDCTAGGKRNHDIAVFEIDERSTRLICPYLKPDKMIIANLSRDSIMRTGHPQYVRDILTEFIPPETKLICNADDLNASLAAPGNDKVYYGIERMPSDMAECTNLIRDVVVCPECRGILKFRYIRYSNIGRAYCPQCGYEAPEYDYTASDVDRKSMKMRFTGAGGSAVFPLLNESIFNIYNQVAATAMLSELGYDAETIADAMRRVSIAKTRYNCVEVNGRRVITMLCKGLNGYAASRVMEYIRETSGDKEIVIMTNSLDAQIQWSEDLCWLYDCDFELLADDSVKQIIVHGDRRYDYKMRLLMAGIPEERITAVDAPEDSLGRLELFAGDNVYVLYDLDVIDKGLKLADTIAERCKKEGVR